MIHNISASFLANYINFNGKHKLTVAEMFKRLSLEMGGDGSTITRKQLNEYIAKAESGSIKISKQKLSALKQIQKNWDTISKGEDSISAGSMKGFEMLLAATMMDSFEVVGDSEDSKDSSDSKSDAYKLLLKNLGLSDIKDATNSDLSTHLNTLLADDSNDDAIGDAIDSLINLMAGRSTAPNVSVEG